MATRSYWLFNTNRSRVKRVIENTNKKRSILNICLLILGGFYMRQRTTCNNNQRRIKEKYS